MVSRETSDELERIWKEQVVAQFEALSHVHSGTGGNQRKLQAVFGPRNEPGISRIQVRRIYRLSQFTRRARLGEMEGTTKGIKYR
jgi:hypothetical protein